MKPDDADKALFMQCLVDILQQKGYIESVKYDITEAGWKKFEQLVKKRYTPTMDDLRVMSEVTVPESPIMQFALTKLMSQIINKIYNIQ